MKLTAIAREDLEAKGLILKNKIKFECRGTAIPDIYAERIGRKNVDTGEFESLFKVDNKNGNTAELDRFRENVTLLEKEHTVFSRETREEKNVIDYYVPYDIQESSKALLKLLAMVMILLSISVQEKLVRVPMFRAVIVCFVKMDVLREEGNGLNQSTLKSQL